VSSIGTGSNQPLVQSTTKTEYKTTLDKMGDFTKKNTADGTLLGDHYVVAGGTALAVGIPAVVLANKYLPQVAKDVIVSKGTGGAINLAASYILAEDAVQSFKDGKTIKAGAETLGATVTGLGGVELVGRQFNIPYAKEAFTATGKFIGNNSKAIIGVGSAGGGVAAIVSGVNDIKDDNKLKGSAKIAGGVVGIAGGAELVGRQFGIKYLDRALTGPLQAVFTSKGGLVVSGGIVAATGLGSAGDGIRRMTTGKGVVNDIIGTAEVTAGVTAITGGTSLVGMATGNEALKKAFVENADVIGAVALGAGATGLAKYTVNDIKEKGVTIVNAATGTGAVFAGLGAVEVVGSKFGIPVAEKAFEKGWQPVLAAGFGVASYRFGAKAAEEIQKGHGGNAAGNIAGAVVAGGASLALAGNAFKIPVLEDVGSKVLETTGDIVGPVVKTMVEHPGASLAVGLITAGALGTAYYVNKHNGESKAEAPAK
jgi:hypothetical protein